MGRIGKPQKSNKNKKLKATFDNVKSSFLDGNKRKQKDLPVEDGQEDNQEMPWKVKQIMKFTCDMKSGKVKKKKHKKKNQTETFRMERGLSKPLQSAPEFIQGKRESDKKFMGRVEKETQSVLLRAKIQDRYKIDISDHNASSTDMKKKPSENKIRKSKERKKKKMQLAKEKKREKMGDFSQFKDDVQFGEVAMEPPSLSVKPRKASADDKPGKRSLLLNQIIAESGSQNTFSSASGPKQKDKKPISKSLAKRQVGQTVKRKFLSPAQQRITDLERDKAINMYRKLKKKNLANQVPDG